MDIEFKNYLTTITGTTRNEILEVPQDHNVFILLGSLSNKDKVNKTVVNVSVEIEETDGTFTSILFDSDCTYGVSPTFGRIVLTSGQKLHISANRSDVLDVVVSSVIMETEF